MSDLFGNHIVGFPTRRLICNIFQPSVALRFINPQPYSGLFEVKLPIFQGDTVSQVKNRLMKTDRSKMKGL